MDQKAEVQKFFDKVVYYTPYEERYIRRTNLNAYDILKRKDIVLEDFERAGVRGGQLLDIGCGPAVFAPDLVSRGFEVWGIDLAPDVVNRATEIMSHHALGHRAHFSVGDIENLGFADSTFDAVLVSGLFDYLPQDEPALQQIRRVLKPGGVAMISLQNRWSYCTAVRALFWPTRPILRALFGEKMKGRELTGNHWTKTHNPEEFQRTARRVGFRPILADYVNFNPIPFNLPNDFPVAFFKTLNAINDSAALRRRMPWLFATALVMLRKEDASRPFPEARRTEQLSAPGVNHDVNEGTNRTVSVVIPMRNEERSIGACLDAVLGQDYPAGLVDVVVVDGGSRDRSREIVESYRRRTPRISLLDNPSGAIPVGLNIGIRASKGELIARVDSRTVLASDYLSTGVRLLQATGAGNVGGPVRSVATSYMGRVFALAMESPFGMGGAAARYRESEAREVDTVYMGLYPRRVLEAIGLYDEELIRDQDDELNFRLRAAGGRVLMSPTLRSSYANSSSVQRFAKQYFLYGYYKVRVFQKYPTMLSWRHLVPPAFVLGLLAGAPLAAVSPLAGAATAAAAGVYVAGTLGAAVLTARREGLGYAAGLVLAFPTFHLSWGAGFLAGLVRFLPRWFQPNPVPPVLARARGSAA